MEKKKELSYYHETIIKLIEKYKLYVEQCLTIVGEKIDEGIKDDKKLNVLKAKRQAAEDAKWAAKEIDNLEKDLNGEAPEKEKVEESKKIGNYAEQHAN